jgi:hypothetical protein
LDCQIDRHGTKKYVVFGIEGENLECAREALEAALGIRMVARESDERCGLYYALHGMGIEHFILELNHDKLEDEWMLPKWKRFGLIFSLGDTERGDEIRSALAGIADLISEQSMGSS